MQEMEVKMLPEIVSVSGDDTDDATTIVEDSCNSSDEIFCATFLYVKGRKCRVVASTLVKGEVVTNHTKVVNVSEG